MFHLWRFRPRNAKSYPAANSGSGLLQVNQNARPPELSLPLPDTESKGTVVRFTKRWPFHVVQLVAASSMAASSSSTVAISEKVRSNV